MDETAAKDEIESHISNSIWEIVESEAFSCAIADTNACGFDIDEYSIDSYDIENNEVSVEISFSATGEQLEDKMFCGNRISGHATLIIHEDESIEYQGISAAVDDHSD
jgi:hypothetical protein